MLWLILTLNTLATELLETRGKGRGTGSVNLVTWRTSTWTRNSDIMLDINHQTNGDPFDPLWKAKAFEVGNVIADQHLLGVRQPHEEGILQDGFFSLKILLHGH